MSRVTVEIVGRRAERGELGRFAERLDDGPCCVIRGDAGIGKTALWQHGLRQAEAAGARVLVTRCAEAELPLSLSGVADLLEPVVDEIAADLSDPQRLVLDAALGRAVLAGSQVDPNALPRAFLASLRALAAHGPVVVGVDDAQWLDLASTSVLAYAVRRLADLSVGILVTTRDDVPFLAPDRDRAVAEIVVGSLTFDELHALVRSRLGLRVPRSVMKRVYEASAGNPLFALEFAPIAVQAPDGPLPVPASLDALIRQRIELLPADVIQLLAAVATLDRPTPQVLARVVDDSAGLVEAAEDAGAVFFDDDGCVRFRHPLLASAAYGALDPSQRRALHARLAPHLRDPEERARQLALGTLDPDRRVARRVEQAATLVHARGAPAAGAILMKQAVRLTPPTDFDARIERMLAAAGYHADAGHVHDARALLDQVLAGGATGPSRARALLLAFLIESDLRRAEQLATEAVAAAGSDLSLRVRALLCLGTSPALRGDVAAAERAVAEAVDLVGQLDDPALESAVLTCASDLAHLQGEPSRELAERAITLAGDNPTVSGFLTPRVALAQQLLLDGDLGEARTLLETDLALLRRRGDDGRVINALGVLVDVEWESGNWALADETLDELSNLVFDGDNSGVDPFVSSRKGVLAAARGQRHEAHRLADETVATGEAMHLELYVLRGRWIKGYLALSAGDAATAWDELRSIVEPGPEPGLHPRGRVRMLPDVVEAAARVARDDDAQAALDTLAAVAHGNWAKLVVLRCRALLMLARGDAQLAAAQALEAAAGFRDTGFPVDEARALLVAGDALRRHGRRSEAASRFEDARAIFDALGAPVWRDRVERELGRVRPHRRPDSDLTKAEQRVASLVASGLTNREVAARTFTTVSTVEVHLTRIYRKLGIRSRSDLTRLVVSGSISLAAE